MDERRWADFAALFTDDAMIVNGDGPTALTLGPGGDAIAADLEQRLGVRTAHHATVPDIEVTGEDTATGSWAALFVQSGRFTGYGFYDDAYRRVGGRWLIHRTTLHTTWAEGPDVPERYRRGAAT
jgi:hypothetical protein